MARRWLKIGSGIAGSVVSIIGLFALLMTQFGFEITGTDDKCSGTMEDPCISYINVTNPTIYDVDIYNQDEISLIFSPQIPEYYLFRKDGRCKGGDSCATPNGVSLPGWNYIDFTNATKPVADKVYVYRFPARTTKEFLLWGLKENPEDIVKWSFVTGKGELDPVWESVGEYSIKYNCYNETKDNWEEKLVSYWSEKNQSNEERYEFVNNQITTEICDEVGVKIGEKEIDYNQEGVNCLRTGDTLCCWDIRDGGANAELRKGEARTTIKEGETGSCYDLSDNLKITDQETSKVWGGIKI